MDRSKRKYYRKRQQRMFGGSDSDESGRSSSADGFVELRPEVVEFPRLHAREEELYFYDTFAYPWEKEKHYRMVYQLEKKYFPEHSLDKAFVDPGAEPVPAAAAPVAEEGVGRRKKQGRKPGKVKEEKDGGVERDETALVFFDAEEKEKERPTASRDVTEKKVEEFFKCLRKVPIADVRKSVAHMEAEGGGEPYLATRRTELPPRWDGPSGTVVLIDKPKGWLLSPLVDSC